MAAQIHIARYDIASPLWSAPPITIAMLSDLHICEPWTPLSLIDRLADLIAREAPDLVLLVGDFLAEPRRGLRPAPAAAIAAGLSRIAAPLGVFACLGNHDWRDCPIARESGYRMTGIAAALENVGIAVLSNAASRLPGGAWLVGLDSQIGEGTTRAPRPKHDPARAVAGVPESASVLMMAHEPDVFLDSPPPLGRVALQLSGHTHGGQIGRLGMWLSPPSRYGRRLDYGLRRAAGRHLIVGAGIGYSTIPVRLGRPSEIVIARLRPEDPRRIWQ